MSDKRVIKIEKSKHREDKIALTDVRHFNENLHLENKKQVLVFPPLSARNRFLIHTLVQNFFNELRTISIGSSYGRRTVIYHSSLKPMLRITESEESNEILDEQNYDMHQAYRTPIERKAQEQLFKSLMPRKNVDKGSRSDLHKKSKRPDIPIYIPRALRGLTNNTTPNMSSNTNNLNSALPPEYDISSKIQDDFSRDILSSEERNNCTLLLSSSSLDSSVDTSNEISVDYYENNETKNLINNISPQNSLLLSSCDLSNIETLKECYSNSFVPNELIKPKSPTLEKNGMDSYILEKSLINCDNDSLSSDLPLYLSVNLNDTSIQNSNLDKLPSSQISNINNIIKPNVLKSQTNKHLIPLNMINDIETTVEDKIIDKSQKHNNKIDLKNELIDSSISEIKIEKKYDTNCSNLYVNDNFSSGQLTEIDENSINNENEEMEMVKNNLEFENKSLNNVKENIKKEKKKKVLDVDECSWEDLYDKEDDYIHPLLMKELASTMGKVKVQCTKEDYRSHQTIEERSGDGECVIELYDFASNLKTIDLMNQFSAFRKNHVEIVWVNDTHALAVFENPNLADRALNTPYAILKTRPLRNAIRESKLKAETVAPLPATRPKTCTAMARRLVSSALGLKVNVSPHLLSAERTMLANAKEKKIRDAQQKNDVWNS